jgi:hypothetical protein
MVRGCLHQWLSIDILEQCFSTLVFSLVVPPLSSIYLSGPQHFVEAVTDQKKLLYLHVVVLYIKNIQGVPRVKVTTSGGCSLC